MEQHLRVLWRRDQAGHEHASIKRENADWLISGVAVFAHDQEPCCLAYAIRCGETWFTKSARITGNVGMRDVDLAIRVDRGEWYVDERHVEGVSGCVDLDLNFSPSTNLLPIRRLGLSVGDAASVRAAWLRFPSFSLEPLTQTYRRTHERVYRYETAGAEFVADITVDSMGVPQRYGEYWVAECSAAAGTGG